MPATNSKPCDYIQNSTKCKHLLSRHLQNIFVDFCQHDMYNILYKNKGFL